MRALVTPVPGRAEAHLSYVDADAATLLLPDRGENLHVLALGEESAAELARLRRRLQLVLRRRRPGLTHIAVVGGGEETRRLLSRLRPLFSFDRRVAVHHVDGPAVWSSGGRLRRLGEAAESRALGSIEAGPLRSEEIEASRARLREHQTLELQARERDRRPASATYGLMILAGLVFALQLVWGGSQSVSTLFRMGANAPERVAVGEAWRLLSSTQLHTGLMHLGVNLFALWSLGTMLEQLLGSRRFFILWGTSALAGAIASAMANQTDLSVGGSGALFGLVGAVAVVLLFRQELVARPARRALSRRLGAPVVLVFLAALSKGSDFHAHLGGALGGGLLMLWPGFSAGVERQSERRWFEPLEATVAAFVLAGLLLLSVGAAFVLGRPWELAAPPLTERVVLGDSGLSLEVPRRLEHHRPERAGKALRWSFGERLQDPIVVEIWVFPSHEESIEAVHERLRSTMAPDARLDWSTGAPMLVLDRRVEHGQQLREWLSDHGAWRVVVRTLAMEHIPPGWAIARERIIRSVRDDTAAH